MTPATGGDVRTVTSPPSAPAGRSLERNSFALAGSAMLTGVVGLLYWAIVGRMYPAREVGAASAVITTATMLSAFGNLSIGALFERFLPLAGARATTMMRTGFLVGGGFGTVLGLGFLLVGPTDEMFDSTGEALLFPVVVAVFSAFALLDHTAVGLREAGWAAAKNVVHAVTKLVLVIGFAFTASRLAVVGTWTIPALLAVVWLGIRVARRARAVAASSPGVELPPRRELGSYLAGAYGIYVVGALAPLILPLVVISVLGADSNAHFSIAWSLVTSVVVLMTMLMGPYVAAAAAEPDRLWPLTVRFLAVLAVVATGGVVLFAVIGPWVLTFVGADYAEVGTPLLRWAAVAIVPAVIPLAYNAIARVRRRLRWAVAVQAVNAVVVVGASMCWIGDHGLVSLGWAYATAETLAAVLLAVPMASALISIRRAHNGSAAARSRGGSAVGELDRGR